MRKQGRRPAINMEGKLYLSQIQRVTHEEIFIQIPTGISGVIIRSQLRNESQTVQYSIGELLVVKFIDIIEGKQAFTPEIGNQGQQIQLGEVIQFYITGEDEGGYHGSRGSFKLILPMSCTAGRQIGIGKYVLAQIIDISGNVCKLTLDLKHGVGNTNGILQNNLLQQHNKKPNGFPGTIVFGRVARKILSQETVGDFIELDGEPLKQNSFICSELACQALNNNKNSNIPLTVYCFDLNEETAYLLYQAEYGIIDKIKEQFNKMLGINNIIFGLKKLKTIQNHFLCKIVPQNTNLCGYCFIRNGKTKLYQYENSIDQVLFYIQYIDNFTGVFYLNPLVNAENTSQIICLQDSKQESLSKIVKELLKNAQLPSSIKPYELGDSSLMPGKMISGVVHVTAQLKDRFMCQIISDEDGKRINCIILYNNLINKNFSEINGLRQQFYILDVQQEHGKTDFIVSISQLPYQADKFCIGRNVTPTVGQVSQGAVIQITDYTYIIQFLQGVKARLPLFAAELSLGKVYNFIVSSVISGQVEVIHTNLPTNEKETEDSLLHVFNYNFLQEYNTKQAQFSTESKLQEEDSIAFDQITSIHPSGFVVKVAETEGSYHLAGKSFILPKQFSNIEIDEKQVINSILISGTYRFQTPQHACIASTYPPIICQNSTFLGKLQPKQQLSLTVIGCTSSYVIFIAPDDMKVRVSCRTQETLHPYSSVDVIVYEPAYGISGCWNGRALSWALPAQNKKTELKDNQQVKKRFQLLKTENLNNIENVDDIFAKNTEFYQTIDKILGERENEHIKSQINTLQSKITPLKAVILINISIGALTGTIVDLGSGILGFISGQNPQFQEGDEIEVFAQGKLILSSSKHFELLQLHSAENDYLELVTVELISNVQKQDLQATVMQKAPDYAILWIHQGIIAGRHILLHCGDFCQKSYVEFQLTVGSTLNLSFNMLSKVKVAKNHFLSASGIPENVNSSSGVLSVSLTELLNFDDLLCLKRDIKESEQLNFIFLNGKQPYKAFGNSYELSAIHSLAGRSSGILKINVEELLTIYSGNYDIKPGFYQFNDIKNGYIRFRTADEIERQPKSAQECQIGQKLSGYITYFDDKKIYVQVSPFLSCHILRHQFEYGFQRQDIKKFRNVIFRVTKPLFKDCVAGVALPHMLSKTFCLFDDLKSKQLHICQIKKIADKHVIVELSDVWPPCRGSASYQMARRNCDREQLQQLYKLGYFYFCVIVDIKIETNSIDIALTPEAFIEIGINPADLENLNGNEKMNKKQKLEENKKKIDKENQISKIKHTEIYNDLNNNQDEKQEWNEEQNNEYTESYAYESDHQEESLDFNLIDDKITHQQQKTVQDHNQNYNQEAEQSISLLGLIDDDTQNDKAEEDNSDNLTEQQLEPEDFERAIQKNRYSSYTFIKYAEYYVRLHQLQEAHKVLERGLESLPLFDSELQNERANLQIVRISLIERYDDIETFYRQGIEILRAFEAPGLLGRRLAEKYLQKAANSSNQEKDKYTGFLELIFACLFKQKKRKRDLEIACLYIRYLFITGKAKKPELQQLADNIEGGIAFVSKALCLIGSLYYSQNDETNGYQFYLNGNKGQWDLDEVDNWCNDVERNKNEVAVRDFYVQITKQSFSTKRELKALQRFLKRFLEFEKNRGGEPQLVQQLTMELLSK